MRKPPGLDAVALSSSASVADYHKHVQERDQKKLADFIEERLTERYVRPIRDGPRTAPDARKLNGFARLALSSLLIETLESFRHGLETTEGVNQGVLFEEFFARDSTPAELKALHGTRFYKHVRCGILHQGETTGGWRVTTGSKAVLWDLETRTINAEKFQEAMGEAVKNYADELESAEWDAPISVAFRDKMNKVIKHLYPPRSHERRRVARRND